MKRQICTGMWLRGIGYVNCPQFMFEKSNTRINCVKHLTGPFHENVCWLKNAETDVLGLGQILSIFRLRYCEVCFLQLMVFCFCHLVLIMFCSFCIVRIDMHTFVFNYRNLPNLISYLLYENIYPVRYFIFLHSNYITDIPVYTCVSLLFFLSCA